MRMGRLDRVSGPAGVEAGRCCKQILCPCGRRSRLGGWEETGKEGKPLSRTKARENWDRTGAPTLLSQEQIVAQDPRELEVRVSYL